MTDVRGLVLGVAADVGRVAPGCVIDTDAGRRAQYAYDASNYRIAPAAVAFPKTAEHVAALVKACHEHEVPITMRGGGTGMAGNTVGAGLVIDTSRHLNRITRIDVDTRTAVVEPGVVLDDLRAAAAEHGLTFGPDPSSHSRCTLGGMIGNDACGNHSVRHGRTSDHVVALDIVLADGTPAVADATGLRAVRPEDASRVAAVADELRAVAARHLAEIRTELGRIPRQVSGYQLGNLLPENGFHLARALVGTEGTCAVITSATVALVPLPHNALLLALGYDDVADAAEDITTILGYSPAAVEGIDEAIVATMRHRRGKDSVVGLPGGHAWLYVDLDGPEPEEVAARAEDLLKSLRANGRLVDGRVVADLAERRSLWRVREDGAGLSSRLVGGAPSWPGWEDAAVAPENLAGYLRDFRNLLTRHGYTGVLYGHFGAGCMHVRIDFDMATDEGVRAMRTFTAEAAELVVAHGGTLSGEHGDGRARGALLSTMYSAAMLSAFAEFKRAFDPCGLLNPGVIVAPDAVDAHLAPHNPPTALNWPTKFTFPHDANGFAQAPQRCVGVGKCRSHSGGVMCPSYRATRDERDSTRGRARALQEMMRGDTITTGWRSKEVADALDLCLSCKACSADCPVDVDMATYKAEFLHHHYARRIRPASHYSLGWLPLWAALATRAPRAVNPLLDKRFGRWMARRGGVAPQRSLPPFASRKELRAAVGGKQADPAAVLFVDSFTRGFRPSVAGAARRVLDDAGVPTSVRSGLCCGLTWVSTGQLSVARRVMRRTVKALDKLRPDLPIVVAEPSCASALRTDVPDLLGTDAARRVAERVRTFPGALAELAAPDWEPPELPEHAVLQTHCHEYATFPHAKQANLLRQWGIGQLDEATGCCGLAGNFGFEAQHYDTSMAVADLALRPALERAPDAPVLADGFSCQLQVSHLDGARQAKHLAELIDDARRMGGTP
ncbi:FAD/FMN-containing dehydrogenase [Herbihabitans rhizosphaerae]|uniref:FAD/FMN-containing dehydrogenase n=1 Tax=Herbihabitans rhizosphaerae TaxID=1872711 RepID=A0A4Q7L3G8_9PSEU|nr:FAD-binding and (Fe-S)-binding domain-containing protein [Herbihabitans rhizosphaerae]RZS43785.1 FAD/FMN-containing dehydrogenase [Herbihabitans rhizosphaerae]